MTLVEAVRNLMRDIRFIRPDEPPERFIPTQHQVQAIRQVKEALREEQRRVEDAIQ